MNRHPPPTSRSAPKRAARSTVKQPQAGAAKTASAQGAAGKRAVARPAVDHVAASKAGTSATVTSRATARKTATKSQTTGRAAASGTQPRLLSGGNPQIAKGYGDAPIQAYIDAMPGWKRDIGRRLDALISAAVPGVGKAVKWNSPLYGIEGQGWFLGLHCYTHYIKVAFFRGAQLKPVPPGASRSADTRYLDIREDAPLDEARFVAWVRQASRLPGERM